MFDKLVSMNEFDEILDFLGEKIRELRREKRLSQEEFAFQCNLDRTYISDVERGKRNISIINLRNIADALGISLSKLFEDFSSTELPNTDPDLSYYKIRADFSTFCGFTVTSNDIAYAAVMTSNQLQVLPFTYGRKKQIVKCYPDPNFDSIIEPFAGSAAYSLHEDN